MKEYSYGTLFCRKTLLIMKLTAALVLVAMLQANANGYGQKLSISVKDAPLETVFKTIHKKTSYNFLYNVYVLAKAAPVTLDVKNATLEEVLALCFKAQPLTYTVVNQTIIVKPAEESVEEQQNKPAPRDSITGKVTDDKGESLPGISVTVKKTSRGTSTNTNGEFTIAAQPGDKLVFTSVGFTPQEYTVGSKGPIFIKLFRASNEMNQTVVIGYGTQSREKVIGSVSTLTGEDLRKMPVTNNTSSLAGKIPGLVSTQPDGHPGDGSTISIRGQSSVNDAAPLYVIDGTIRAADNFAELDPNDIESISVLKDAGSAAVYGVRATNGVIVVTTKHGRLGKPVFSLTGSVTSDQPTMYPKEMNAYQFASYQKAIALNLGTTPNYTDQQIQEYKTGQLPSTDWQKVAYGNHATTTMNNLNMSGGTDAVKYFFSFGYTNQNGIYPNVGYNRYNFRTNLDVKINKTLTATVNLEGKASNNFAPNISDLTLWTWSNISYPTVPAYFSNGQPYYYYLFSIHPGVATRESGYNKTLDNLFIGGLTLTQQLPFVPGLSAKGSIQVWREYNFQKVWNLPYNVYDSMGNAHPLNGKTSLAENMQPYNTYTLDLSLDYARSFGQHSVKGLILYEQYAMRSDNLGVSRTNYPFNTIDEIFAGAADNTQTTSGTAAQDGRLSVVGRLNYDYAAKYLFEANFRDDASWRFAPGRRWGLFPSFSAGWIASKENFLKDVKGLDFLKLRGSWGILGNDNVGGFQYLASYNLNTTPYFLAPTTTPASLITPGVVPYPALTWESTAETNLGIDAIFLHKLIGLSFDAFQKNTYNMYGARNNQYPGVYGATLPSENYGRMAVRGWELAVTHENQIGKVHYSISGNVSFNRNKVTRLDYTPNTYPWSDPIGKPLNYTTGYVAKGLYQTDAAAAAAPHIAGTTPKAGDIQYVDLNHDGIIDQRDQKILSWNNAGGVPGMMYGLTMDAAWKGISLNVFFQGVAQRSLMYSYYLRNGEEGGNAFAFFMDYWSPANPNGKYPRPGDGLGSLNDVNSSYWLHSGAFLRLKNVQLAYNLPSTITTKMGLTRVRFYISGFNLAVFSKIKDFDPELPQGTSNMGMYYPQNKSLVAGANISF